MSIFWLNGKIVPPAQARIPLLDHGLLYGDGVFEGLRFYNGRVFRLAQHLNRLVRSAAAIALKLPYGHREIASAMREVISAYRDLHGDEDGYLRLVVTRGEGRLGIDPTGCKRGNMFIIADQLALTDKSVQNSGARVVIASTRRLSPDGLDPRIKSLNYLNNIMARLEANAAGADEAIMLNSIGNVAEGTADNVFIVGRGVLKTPPLRDGPLDGITRGVLMELAKVEDIPCEEVSLSPYDLYTADECILCGTGAEIIPVREIDGRAVKEAPGRIFMRLRTAFSALIDGETSVASD